MKISVDEAKKLYPTAPDWLKEKLDDEFGAETFQAKAYEEIKTFEDACAQLGIDPLTVCNPADTTDEAAYKKLKVVVKAVNNGWQPDWNKTDQRKWWPWFRLSSGFGFSVSDFDCVSADSGVGSRLCFQTEEKSDYTAKQFIELYKDFITIQPESNE